MTTLADEGMFAFNNRMADYGAELMPERPAFRRLAGAHFQGGKAEAEFRGGAERRKATIHRQSDRFLEVRITLQGRSRPSDAAAMLGLSSLGDDHVRLDLSVDRPRAELLCDRSRGR
jgi:hypothetical protein